jgi:hypothetical protein
MPLSLTWVKNGKEPWVGKNFLQPMRWGSMHLGGPRIKLFFSFGGKGLGVLDSCCSHQVLKWVLSLFSKFSMIYHVFLFKISRGKQVEWHSHLLTQIKHLRKWKPQFPHNFVELFVWVKRNNKWHNLWNTKPLDKKDFPNPQKITYKRILTSCISRGIIFGIKWKQKYNTHEEKNDPPLQKKPTCRSQRKRSKTRNTLDHMLAPWGYVGITHEHVHVGPRIVKQGKKVMMNKPQGSHS